MSRARTDRRGSTSSAGGRRQRPRTVSISIDLDVRKRTRVRGQTTQDFAIGIGVFLLAVAAVFMIVPTFVTPFETSTGSAEVAQADRIADTIVDDLSESSEHPNELDETEFEAYPDDSEGLAAEVGLRTNGEVAFDKVNVTIESIDASSEPPDPKGDDPNDATTVSSTRIVTLDESDPDDVYRLVVRVW
ncbi:hypothetical protein ACFQGT_01045 [Natrialbaceae archaeon GCM10025810]|uniref:DUF7287 family protein n=1 Tax=Halovalidus salilacus TaxID=3075124 RepID=UPI00360703D9